MGSKIGRWSFVIGVVIALIVGLFANSLSTDVHGWLILLLVVLGLLVGLLNISEKETTPFLVATAALLITSAAIKTKDGTILDIIPTVGLYLAAIVQEIAVFVMPAAIVVSLKAIQSLAKE